MNEDTEIARLSQKLRRDLKGRFIVWPVLIILFGSFAFLNYLRIEKNMKIIADWDLAAATSPDMIRWAAIQGIIPITLGFVIIAVNLLACAYCLVQLIRPRTEAHLLLALTERSHTNQGSQQIGDGNAEKQPGDERKQ